MFSGKSEELIRRLRRAEYARQRVQIFKPTIDERYAANEIVSHSGLGISSDTVMKAEEIMDKVQPRTEVIGIDEAQFLGEGVVDVCTRLANLGKRVIVTGLDTDYRGRPFEPMPRLLAVAEEITKLLAICVRCGNPAVHTQRLVESEELVVVGAAGIYEARCRRCFGSGKEGWSAVDGPQDGGGGRELASGRESTKSGAWNSICQGKPGYVLLTRRQESFGLLELMG